MVSSGLLSGPVRLSYNPYFSACFFSWNNIFLSQQISEQYFQPWFFSEANGLSVAFTIEFLATDLFPSSKPSAITLRTWLV
jgi:hypothetical protein